MKKQPTTSGSEWLFHSMSAFNGSGFADKTSPQNYVESYLFYNAWKKRPHAVELCKKFEVEALTFAEKLCEARPAGKFTSQKKLQEFEAFKNRTSLLI